MPATRSWERLEKVFPWILDKFNTSISNILGTYGTVFKARDKESDKTVALKVVKLDDEDEVWLF
jgi:hypothetical protein